MRFLVSFFVLSSFPIKMLATDAKMQKIEPDPNFFMMDESFRDSVTVSTYLFFNVQKYQTRISDSVCNDLKTKTKLKIVDQINT